MLTLQVSIGEAIDKYTILQLKKRYIKDELKLIEINKELDYVQPFVTPFLNDVREEYNSLLKVNDDIWKYSDFARENKNNDILQLIMNKNDLRYQIKNIINIKTKSVLKEQKNFTKINNYVCQGRLGDLIHCLYAIFIVYETEGIKGNLYITDSKYKFSRGLKETYDELVPIISQLNYINSFSILSEKDEKDKKNENLIDLSSMYTSPLLYKSNWCHIVANIVGKEQIPKPWLNIKRKENNLILVHRNMGGLTSFPWENILKKNICYFITCKEEEYKNFPYNNLLKCILCKNLEEICEAIAGCKFFIGNQSSPLAIACAMHKPCLAELNGLDAVHYINETKNNKEFHWFYDNNLSLKPKEIYLSNIIENTGNIFSDIVSSYFGQNFKGICIDVGACMPQWGSTSYFFEKRGWKTICIEPIPSHCIELRKERAIVVECACGSENKEADFEIVHLHNNFTQGAISSLKVDERLINSHENLLNYRETIKVKVRTLNSILEEYGIEKVDYISIDTENTELDVLKGFDINKYKPHLMLIENNFNEPFIENYLKDFGYKKIERHQVNDYYKRMI